MSLEVVKEGYSVVPRAETKLLATVVESLTLSGEQTPALKSFFDHTSFVIFQRSWSEAVIASAFFKERQNLLQSLELFKALLPTFDIYGSAGEVILRMSASLVSPSPAFWTEWERTLIPNISVIYGVKHLEPIKAGRIHWASRSPRL